MSRPNHRIRVVHRTRRGRVRLVVPSLRGQAALAARFEAFLRTRLTQPFRLRLASESLVFPDAGDRSDAAIEELCREALRDALSDTLMPPVSGPPARGRAETDWWSPPADELVADLATDPAEGLTQAEAGLRLARDGANRLPSGTAPSQLAMFAEQFESLPVLLLSGSAILSLVTGGIADAVATLSVVGVNAVLGHLTESEAEASIHRLMDASDEPVLVRRDGLDRSLSSSGLVAGDIVTLRAGAKVPADARLLESRDLRIDESALTGETDPVEKHPDIPLPGATPIGGRSNMVHSGTIVSQGAGRAMVVATGPRTESARIAALSQTARRPPAPVEVELDRMGRKLVSGSLVACGLLFVVGLMRGMPLSVILKDSLALAVAAVPEGLPVVATTTMARGLKRMERRGILVRQIEAVESLGALQTLCLDKTGTLTQNRLTVAGIVTGLDRDCETSAIVQRRMAEVATLNNDADLIDGSPSGSSATERALLAFALDTDAGLWALRRETSRTHVVERTLTRPWMAISHAGNGPVLTVKGSPEALLKRCSRRLDATGSVVALSAADRARLLAANDAVAARPARVLGFAVGDRPAETEEAVEGLIWLGLVGMTDPLRDGAKEFVAGMHRAGIRTVMITGDQAATAKGIAQELDLAGGGPLRVVDAPALSALPPEVLRQVAAQTHVFSRVSASEKLLIVQALQAAGQVVGMTGDGVNDAPALKAANVGIAMGASGTDLAREIANVVVKDDTLPMLYEAVAQGRSVYRNIRRALEYLITTNMSEIAVGLVEAMHGPGELETPMELLWINIVSDVLPGLGLAMAKPDHDVMNRPPRAADEQIIPAGDLQRLGTDSATIAGASLLSHFVGLAAHGPGPQTRAMTFLSLALGQLLYTLVCQRSDVRKLRPDRLLENRPLDAALLASAGAAVLPFFVPRLGRLLGIAPVAPGYLGVALGCAILPAASVLARRGILVDLDTVEGRPCENS